MLQQIYVVIFNTTARSVGSHPVKSFIRLTQNYINYSPDNQNNILCYRRFDFTSEVFIRNDFQSTYGTSFYIPTTAIVSQS